MAAKKTSKQNVNAAKPVVTEAAKRAAEVEARKEARAKLRTLSALAKAEVVNDAVEKVVTKQFTGFVDFIREQSVVGLAIGLVLGTQVKQLVDSIVNNLILPVTGLILPGKEALDKKVLHLTIPGKPTAVLHWGAVVATFISFLAVVGIVYAIFKSLKLDRLSKKKEIKIEEKTEKSKKKKK